MRFRTYRRARSGQALVEFTLVVPLLMLLVFSIIDFSLYFYTRISVRHVVRESARFAITGDSLQVLVDTSMVQLNRINSMKHIILNGAPAVTIKENEITITPDNGGGPGEVVTIRVRHEYPAKLPPFKLLWPSGRLMINVSTVTKNELYNQ